ncbi:MAG: hypothetical protein PHQ43_04395 [Dehalococcoidales bacterium]|nr:hypothetical protein [Dehalococcoidales bacterium]
MELSPDERRRIYEEERAKLEAERTTELKPNVSGLLCYLGVWVTGIIFLIIERKDRWIRFHAMQSLITFGILSIIIAIADAVRHWNPFCTATPLDWLLYPQIIAANIIFGIFWAISIVLWIFTMYQTYHGHLVKLAIFGDLAEKAIAKLDGTEIEEIKVPPVSDKPESEPATAKPGARVKTGHYLEGSRSARITASVAAIGWSAFFFVLFNFFSGYVAIYSHAVINGINTWVIHPILTPALSQVLPILNVTLIAAIVCHAVAIAIDRYRLRAVILITLAGLSMATVLTFLRVFPFDFSVIPNPDLASIMPTLALVIMIIITAGIGIGALVRFIRLMIDLAKKPAPSATHSMK